MNPTLNVTFCGRAFTAQEVELMRTVAHDYAQLGVTEIARTICELLEWKRPSGGLKNHECRQLLERLQAEGVLMLPALRHLGGKGPRRVDISQQRLEPEPVECAARECEPLNLSLVEGETESRRWREQVERYHYLGCRAPFGANLRYWVRSRDRELACLLWTSPAWKMQARDAWIGWSDEGRQRNLQGIVNNGRFLILPWVRVLGLASKILALSARQLPHDWQTRYGHRPLLLETLVDASRFRGTCYRAATGSMLDRPPDAVAWIGSTKPTPTPSKTSMSIRWSVMPADIYAAIPPCKQILLLLYCVQGAIR